MPQSFATFTGFGLFAMEPVLLSTPRVANPHPERTLRCLDLVAPQYNLPVLLLGVTLVPSPSNPSATPTE